MRSGEGDHGEDVRQFGAGEQVGSAGEFRRSAVVAHTLRERRVRKEGLTLKCRANKGL